MNYMVATLSKNQISVVTMHRVPEYFNNNQVTQRTVMKDYPIRYQSQTSNYFTFNGAAVCVTYPPIHPMGS